MGEGPRMAELSEEFDRRNQKANDEFWSLLNEYETMISDNLPIGYYVKVEDTK
jgi:hypothetical protein